MRGHETTKHDLKLFMQRPGNIEDPFVLERFPSLTIMVEVKESQQFPLLSRDSKYGMVRNKVRRKKLAISILH